MKLFNNLPLYEAIIANEECGVYKVSLVTDPATEVDFIAFDENKPIVKFAVDNKVEHMVSGVIMLASTPIYRRTPDNYEYYITYSPDTLKQMAEKMIFDGVGSNVNIQHQDGTDVDGVNLVELYVIDREKGIAPEYFKDVPNGSLIGTYKVHNPDVWSMIENGDVLSFSLEGVFQVEEAYSKQDNNNNKTRNYMSKIKKIKEMLRKILVEFGSVSTDKAVVLWDGDEELKAGDSVWTIDEEGNEVNLEDGDYKTEDGKVIVIADNKVVEIKDDEAEVATDEPTEEPVEEENAENEPESEDEPENEETPAEDEKDAEIKRLMAQIEELKAENEELKAKVAELEKEPAAPSAEEEFAAMENDNTKANKLRNRGYRF